MAVVDIKRTIQNIDFSILVWFFVFGADGRNRTGTRVKSRRILSPVRLPVPPHLHLFELTIIILLRDDYNCQDILQKNLKILKIFSRS